MKYLGEITFTSAEKVALFILTAALTLGILVLHIRHHYVRPKITIARDVFNKELTATEVEAYLRERRSVSLNEADVVELTSVPGIGEKTAEKIIEYRENNGPFTAERDLLNIKGIGEKKLEKMLPYVKI